MAENLWDWQFLLDALQISGNSLGRAIIIVGLGYLLAANLRRRLSHWLKQRSTDATVMLFAVNAAYALLLVALGIVFLGALGIPTASLVTLLGASTLALALALKDSCTNIASGLILIALRPFKLGDTLLTGSVSGQVEQINLFYTKLCSGENETLYIPNKQLLNQALCNKTQQPRRRLQITLNIAYQASIPQTKAVLQELLATEPAVLANPEPLIAVQELGAHAVVLTIRPWVAQQDYNRCLFALNEKIKQALDEAGIPIAYPQLDVHLKNN